MSRTFLRGGVVASSLLQTSFALIPLLNLPAEGRGSFVLGLAVSLFVMIGGVGLIAQARPAFRDAAIIVNGLLFLFTLPQNVSSIVDPTPWRAMTVRALTSVWFAMAWGGSSAFNVIALAQLKRQDARGKQNASHPARDWGAG